MNRHPQRRGSRKVRGIGRRPGDPARAERLRLEILRLCEQVAAKLATRYPDDQVPFRTAVRRILHVIAEGKVTLDEIRQALDYLEPRH